MYRTTSHINPPKSYPVQGRPMSSLEQSYYQKARANALLARLQDLDPAGWEAWFDSDAVPDADCKLIADTIQARILVLEATPAESCSCPASDAAGVSGSACPVCREETQTDEIPFN